MNNRGSILVITSCFVLVFTMLGLAAIHLAGTSVQMAEEENFSTQALWLADAGVERSKSILYDIHHSFNDPTSAYYSTENHALYNDVPLANGKYTFSAKAVPGYNYRWKVQSDGRHLGSGVNPERAILATISGDGDPGAVNIEDPAGPKSTCDTGRLGGSADVYNTNGTLNTECDLVVTGLGVNGLNGLYPDVNSFVASCLGSSPPATCNSATVVTTTASGNTPVPASSAINPLFLIFDNRSGGQPVHFSGVGDFWGIIWIVGDVKTTGTGIKVHGALFVEQYLKGGTYKGGDGDFQGNSAFYFDDLAIDKAFGYINTAHTPSKPMILDWKEI